MTRPTGERRPVGGSIAGERHRERAAVRHGALQSIALHLAPGAAVLVAYLAVFGPIVRWLGLPDRVAYVVTVTLVALPILLLPLRRRAVLLRPHGNRASTGVVVLVVLALFVWAGVVSAAGSRMEPWMRQYVFWWLPSSFLASELLDTSGYSSGVLVGTRIASTMMIGIIVPVAEELYFRGFLLPRVPWGGTARILAHSTLFAAAHFLSPWAFITRMLILIPMVGAVWRTGRLSIGIVVHCGGNTVGEVVALITVLQAMKP